MKLAIGLVHGGSVDGCCLRSIIKTLNADWQGPQCIGGRVLEGHAPGGMTHVAWNALITEFLGHPDQPDALLKVDSDHAWTPDDVWALRDTAMTHGFPIVGGVVQYPVTSGGQSIPMMFDAQLAVVMPPPDGQRLVQVFCGSFQLIHRDVYLKLAAAHPGPTPYYNYEHWNGKAGGDDVIFSQRVADLGIPVYVDTSVRIGHRKMHTFEPPVPREVLA